MENLNLAKATLVSLEHGFDDYDDTERMAQIAVELAQIERDGEAMARREATPKEIADLNVRRAKLQAERGRIVYRRTHGSSQDASVDQASPDRKLPEVGQAVEVDCLGQVIKGVVTAHSSKDGKPTIDYEYTTPSGVGSKWAWLDQIVSFGPSTEGELPSFKPATLSVEAVTSHEFPSIRFAQVELTQQFVERLQALRDLCVKSDLMDVRVFGAPDRWSGESQWRPDSPCLRVSKHDFWYEAVPKNVDAAVRTEAVDIDAMVALLRQQTSQHDIQSFGWINGNLYCDGSNAELLADDVAEYFDAEVKPAPSSGMCM